MSKGKDKKAGPQGELASVVWDHCLKYAQTTGTVKKEKRKGNQPKGLQENFSLWWFFAEMKQKGKLPNDLVRAYCVGDDAVRRELLKECESISPPLSAKLDRTKYIGKYAPNDTQWQAICAAVDSPISFIQGPPGTGKTDTILNLVYQLWQLRKDKKQEEKMKIAIVSSNGAALENIHEKLEDPENKEPKIKIAKLGGKELREEFWTKQGRKQPAKEWEMSFRYSQEEKDGPVHIEEEPDPDSKEAKKKWGEKKQEWQHHEGNLQTIRREKSKTVADLFDAGFAAFTSTAHSLPACFFDGLLYQYDYVIVDETSQMDVQAGLVAMSHARHLVLVGDEKQLAPVIRTEVVQQLEQEEKDSIDEEGVPLWDSLPEVYRLEEDRSFLDLCLEIFHPQKLEKGEEIPAHPTALKVLLNEHYRCHPGIIGFCNENVYGKSLDVRTLEYDQTVNIPIRVLQFDGDYCEWRYAWDGEGEPPEKMPGGRSKCNRRQVEIFMAEEWPQLHKDLKNNKLSVCILSPFRGQLDLLKKAIAATKSDVAVEESEHITESHCLTIHKSQGQEFDIVYLLPVEDGAWEWPFSQKERMVNVAVSRAKKELRIITSTKYTKNGTQTDDEGEMFLKKLVEYVDKNAGEGDKKKGFGIHETELKSIFDDKKPQGGKKTSSGQALVEKILKDEILPSMGSSWEGKKGYDREVLIEDVLKELGREDLAKDPALRPYKKYIHDRASFDIVIRDSAGVPRLAIEVDGAYHRFSWKREGRGQEKAYQEWRERWKKDKEKEKIVEAMGGEMYCGNHRKLRGGEDQWGQPAGTFALLRLPDDGSTFLETDELIWEADEEGKDLSDQIFTIQDIIKKYIPATKKNCSSKTKKQK